MNTAPSLPRAKRERPSPPAKSSAAHSASPAPHIYQPATDDSPRDLAGLFDLKQRPGYYNAAAKTALLRQAKTGPSDELLVDFSRSEVKIELRGAGAELLRGDWTWQASAAGKPLAAAGDWTEVCWNREKACDYLEIELPLSHGWKLERQMLLARNERFLWLADALLGPADGAAAEIRHAHSLPLASGSAYEPADETREGSLTIGQRRLANVVPPALAEWRAEYCHAELSPSGGRLNLQQAALGRNLYAPLWIDLDPRRAGRPLTWRRLTVGENLAIVPRDAAAAYRIQAGREQWLIYRSLAPVGNRSVLGLNTCASFVCARISASGETKEIVAIE